MAAQNTAFSVADAWVLASIRLVRTLRAISRSEDLSESEISALAIIVYAKGVAARDLAKMEEVTPATISRLVAALERKGLLRRTPDRKDARLQWLHATAEGVKRIRQGHARRLAPLAKAIAALPRGQRDKLHGAIAILDELIAEVQSASSER